MRLAPLLGWAVWFLFSCAGQPPTKAQADPTIAAMVQNLSPVRDPEQRRFLLGCSLLPPERERWSVAIDHQAQELLFMRERISPTHSLYARTWSTWVPDPPTTPEELRARLTKRVEQAAGGRFSNTTAQVQLQPGRAPLWASFVVSSEDHAVPGHEGVPFTMTTHAVMFVHPDAPNLVVYGEISERRGPGDSGPSREMMQAYLDSIRITRPDLGSFSSFAVGQDPNAILHAHGSLWIACKPQGSAPGKSGEVVRLDPTGGAVVARIRLGGEAVGITATEDAVWVTLPSERKLVRIEPRTNAVVKSVSCGKQPWQLASEGGFLFVVDSDGRTLWKLDGASGQPVGKPNRDFATPRAIASAQGMLWVTDIGNNLLWCVDPATLQPKGSGIRIGPGAFDVKAGGGALWVKSFGSRSIQRIDPVSREIVATIPTPGPWASGMGFARDRLWVCDYADGSLCALDPETNRFAAPIACVGLRPGNLTTTPDALWINDRATGEVRRLAIP